jgi:non-ribosomal peptide synthase protein (TIGR01720 family)
MDEQAATLESTLQLDTGPLARAALFMLGSSRPARLFITCHHLVIDGISWQPLLADLETAYHQIRQNQKVELPAKTTSYKEWAEKLVEYARSPVLAEEVSHWQAVAPAQQSPDSPGNSRVAGHVHTVSRALGQARTAAFLREAHDAYNTKPLDLLLAAWTQAYGEWFGADTAPVMLEGHGREADTIGAVDLGHTVGWFTSHYPVLMRPGEKWQPGNLLKQVKEQLRQVPRNGLGYGILRYVRAHPKLVAQPEPPVLFNYLGQFERALPVSDLFTLAKPLQGAYGPRNRPTHSIEVNTYIRHEQLQVDLLCDGDQHTPDAQKTLLDAFVAYLEELIDHCLSADAGEHTPSDFELAELTEKQFDRLSLLLDRLDGE